MPGIKVFPFGEVSLIAMDAGPQPEHVYAGNATSNLTARAGINPLNVNRTISITEKDLSLLRDLSERLGHESLKASRMKAGYYKAPDRGFEFYGTHFVSDYICLENREIDKITLQRNINTIQLSAEKTTFVIVYLHHHHWENDWERSPQWVIRLARQCIDAGANVFVSHGIPILQGIEIYRNRPIFFSLGNFIYHTQRPKERSEDDRLWQSVVASCNFDPKGNLDSMELIPIVLGGERALQNKDYINRMAPHLAGKDYGMMILEKLKGLCKKHETDLKISNARGFIVLK
jgi:poly-gamma-glutamate synthesis protein (capsule biosynthesis protein)